MINWPVKRHVIRACKTRSRVLLPLVVVSAMLTTLIVGARRLRRVLLVPPIPAVRT